MRGQLDGHNHGSGTIAGGPALLSESELLLEHLRAAVRPSLFNQYSSGDPTSELPDAAQRRCANLRRYLTLFQQARFVLVGEAVGYAGGRVTGVPLTDEVLLIGPRAIDWAGEGNGFQRCSRTDRPPWRELSAQAVWGMLGQRVDVALWNVVPWHPPGRRGPLSNARPDRAALIDGVAVLRFVLEHIWPNARVIAMGRIAEAALRELGREPFYVRHPAHGGIPAFRDGLSRQLAL